jgi:hypothetical protein
MGLVALGITPQGRRLARHLMQPCPFIADLAASCTPHMASAFLHAPDGPEQPSIFDQPQRAHTWQRMSLTLRQGPWFACCSAILVPPADNIWGQDRQHFLSLWADGLGLLIGQGNSRNQPAWSTFVVAAPAGRRYLPDRSGLLPDGVWLDYGPTRCSLRLELHQAEARILAALAGAAEPTMLQLQLRLRPGLTLRLSDGSSHQLGTQPVRIEQPPGTLSIGPDRWSIDLPRPWSLDWPVRPFNPYAKDGYAPIAQAAAILALPLSADNPTQLTVRPGS